MDPIWERANPHLRDLDAYEPGKPIEETARELGRSPDGIVKLASNENPLGPSLLAVEAMRRAAAEANFYPDGGGFALRTKLAAKLEVTPEQIVLGNGSNEIIEFIGHAFLRPGAEMITSENAFIAYKLVASLFGARTIEVPDQQYCFDLEAVTNAITPRTRVIFIANPNNPTGTIIGQEQIDHFMARVPEEVVVVFDEAYFEYLDNPPDTLKFVRQGYNAVVLRTFSKIHGLAGARIGYGVARAELAHLLHKTREPFNINSLAQAGAIAALDDEVHQAASRRLTSEGRAFLETEFSALGLTFVAGSANFILVRVGDGKRVFQSMLRHGVIVRALTGYKFPEWVRISVGTMEQNRRCITALREVLVAA